MIEQTHPDLIFAIIKNPVWTPIPYVVDGIYDRCVANFQEHKKDEVLIDNDKYDWVRIPAASYIRTIYIAKPGKIVEQKYKYYRRSKTDVKCSLVWTNVVRMDLFFYRSMTYKNIQGFTFGDRHNILKPLKILDHHWARTETAAAWDCNTWTCAVCGLAGKSHDSNMSALIPEELLTCDEKLVENILT
jgi:hypothetical protein